MNLKIRDKIIGMMVISIILPILLIGWRSYSTSSKALKDQYYDMGKVIAGEVNVLIRDRIEQTNKLLRDLESNPAIHNIEVEGNLDSVMQQFKRTGESYEFADVYFGSSDGKIHSGLGVQNPDIDVRERPWYIKATENDNIVWSDVYKDATSGKNTVTVSSAVYDGDILKGVVAIDINMEEFSSLVTEVDILGGYPLVLDKEGTIIVDRNIEGIGKKFEGISAFSADEKGMQTDEYHYVDKENNIDQKQLIMFQFIEGSDWSVATIVGMDAMEELNSKMIRDLLIIGIITVIIGVIISILFGKHIANSIHQILIIIRRMGEGDFTARINTKNTDEFGELRDVFNTMMDTISELIRKIKTASTSVDEYSGNLAAISEEVSASSLEVSTTADEIAKGASNQADDTEIGVTLINNLSEKLVELDSTSGIMVNLAEEIRATSKESTIVVEDLRVKTQLNNESSEKVSEEIIELDRRISEVTEILSTIDAISEQTNLLALNASIEAARAGEYGKGFAVVADEIRQLAGESKESSNNIKNIIEAVQTESKKTVDVIGDVNAINIEQTQAVERVNESFGTINSLIEQIVSKISDIDDKSTEMNEDRNEIVRTIENISAISQETAAASEEVTASIEQQTSATEEVANSAGKLNELSNELNREISVFKI